MKLGLAVGSTIVEDLFDGPLTRRILGDIRRRSLRGRIWFSSLDRMELGIVDLTIRLANKILNSTMARVLSRISEKLVPLLEQSMA